MRERTFAITSHMLQQVFGCEPPPRPVVVVFSGKRKSGKDYITERLVSMLVIKSSRVFSYSDDDDAGELMLCEEYCGLIQHASLYIDSY